MRFSFLFTLLLIALVSCQNPLGTKQTSDESGSPGLNLDFSSAEQVPLIVLLYDGLSNTGKYITLLESEKSLVDRNFNDKTTSVSIMKGSGYDAWVVNHRTAVGSTLQETPCVLLWKDIDQKGGYIALGLGNYQNLGNLGFDHIASSVSVAWVAHLPTDYLAADTPSDLTRYQKMSLVVETYIGTHYSGTKQVFVAPFGVSDYVNSSAMFDIGSIQSLIVKQGPDWGSRDVTFETGRNYSIPVTVSTGFRSEDLGNTGWLDSLDDSNPQRRGIYGIYFH